MLIRKFKLKIFLKNEMLLTYTFLILMIQMIMMNKVQVHQVLMVMIKMMIKVNLMVMAILIIMIVLKINLEMKIKNSWLLKTLKKCLNQLLLFIQNKFISKTHTLLMNWKWMMRYLKIFSQVFYGKKEQYLSLKVPKEKTPDCF